MNRWQRSAGVAVAVSVLGLAGCGDDDTDVGSPPNSSQQMPGSATATGAKGPTSFPADTAPVAAAQQGLRTAAAVANGRAFDLEIETGNGVQVFDIKVASNGNEIEVLVDRSGNEVLDQSRSSKPSDDVSKVEGAGIDPVRGLQAAADREPEAQVSQLEIDTNRDGVLIWQIELLRSDHSEVEIDVDAQSGEVIGSGQG